jgi:hypothetical protein
VKRAERGDESALPAVRELLLRPEAVDLLGGDLARQAERSLINVAAGKNLAFREALLRKLELMRAELAGPGPTPLERLLVERVAACWLHLHDLETRFAQARNLLITQADHQQRTIDRAHRRYLTAIKTLAVVRRLAVPALVAQVNIAGQQVNTVKS